MAHAVLTNIEGILAEAGIPRITVRHDHVAQRGAVQDRPDLSLIFIAHGVEDKAFSWRESNAEAPFLPADLMSICRETGSFLLHDLQGFLIAASLGNVSARPVC